MSTDDISHRLMVWHKTSQETQPPPPQVAWGTTSTSLASELFPEPLSMSMLLIIACLVATVQTAHLCVRRPNALRLTQLVAASTVLLLQCRRMWTAVWSLRGMSEHLEWFANWL